MNAPRYSWFDLLLVGAALILLVPIVWHFLLSLNFALQQ